MVTSGYEISSGSYGFPLLYDLLVGVTPLKLHPSDRTHNWGRLFVRLLPSAEFSKKKAEMSLLRILSENPTLAMHPHIPKLQLDSGMNKLKGMFKGNDAISRLLADSHEFLRKDAVRPLIRGPDVYRECESQTTIVLKPAESFTHHWLWIVPQVADYSQSEFELDVQSCSSVNIPLAQLKAFAATPLSLINVDAFVWFLSRSESQLPHVLAEVPFNISGDRATKMNCSESTLQRITSDVKKYTQKTNAETIPTLIGFSYSDIESLHH